MEILQPYNNNTLELISSGSYEFTPDMLNNGVIKLSVFSDVGGFLDLSILENNIDFYVRNNDLFLKPNEFLDRSGFSEGNYNLQYDFLRRLDTSNFHISQVSPSGKEIRLEIAMTDQSLLRWLNEVLGVGTMGPRKVKPGRKKQWRWRCSHRDAYYVCCLIWPWAHTKLPKIQKIIEHYAKKKLEKGADIVNLNEYKMRKEMMFE